MQIRHFRRFRQKKKPSFWRDNPKAPLSLFLGSSLNQALRLFQARGYSNKLEVTFFEAFCWGQNNLKNEVISLNLDSVSGIPFFSFLDFAWPWLSCLLLLVWVSG